MLTEITDAIGRLFNSEKSPWGADEDDIVVRYPYEESVAFDSAFTAAREAN
jgi:hypothetical protein